MRKSALIKFGGHVAVAIEPNSKINKSKTSQELLEMASKHGHTKNIKKIFYSKKFPVDVRHNIKIDRVKMGKQATEGTLK